MLVMVTTRCVCLLVANNDQIFAVQLKQKIPSMPLLKIACYKCPELWSLYTSPARRRIPIQYLTALTVEQTLVPMNHNQYYMSQTCSNPSVNFNNCLPFMLQTAQITDEFPHLSRPASIFILNNICDSTLSSTESMTAGSSLWTPPNPAIPCSCRPSKVLHCCLWIVSVCG